MADLFKTNVLRRNASEAVSNILSAGENVVENVEHRVIQTADQIYDRYAARIRADIKQEVNNYKPWIFLLYGLLIAAALFSLVTLILVSKRRCSNVYY